MLTAARDVLPGALLLERRLGGRKIARVTGVVGVQRKDGSRATQAIYVIDSNGKKTGYDPEAFDLVWIVTEQGGGK